MGARNGGNGLKGHFELKSLARGDAAQTAARVVSLESKVSVEEVVVFRAPHFGPCETRTEFEAFGGGNGHHSVCY